MFLLAPARLLTFVPQKHTNSPSATHRPYTHMHRTMTFCFSRLLNSCLWALLFCWFAAPLSAQGWLQLLPDQGTFAVTKVVSRPSQGCYMAVSVNPQSNTDRRAFLCHYDTAGNFVWRNEFLASGDVSDLVLTDDNGLTAIGFDLSATKRFLYHFDAQGTLRWKKDLDLLYGQSKLANFPGGGYVSDQSYRENFPLPPSKLSLYRLDTAGTRVWRSVVDTLSDKSFLQNYGLAVNAAGQSILAYRYGTLTAPKYFLGVFDPNGDTLWRKSLPYIQNAGVLPDGNFVCFFSNAAAGYTVQKIAPNGNLIWQTTFPEFFSLAPGIVLPSANGGFAVGGTGVGPNGKTIRVSVFDAQGQVTNTINRTLPGFGNNNFNVTAIAPAEDGGFYVNGTVWDATNTYNRVFLLRMDANGRIFGFHLLGTVAYDVNEDCQLDSTDRRLDGQILHVEDLATGNVYFVSTDSLGVYSTELDSSELRVGPLPLNPYWRNCKGDTLATFQAGTDTLRLDFPLQKVVECPFLEVDISTWGLRRCFDNRYYVRYCNTGTADAHGVYVEVDLDPHLAFLSASIPSTHINGNKWRFPIGTVPLGTCKNFYLDAHLDCDSTVLGQTHCTTAHIYPDSFCLQTGPWSGANVEVAAQCHPDSVRMAIYNTGTGPNAGPLEYIVIEDNIIFRQGNFQLNPGDSLVLYVPANGSTWRIEADQEPFAPGSPAPSATVEGCGANTQGAFSIGFVSQFGENDGDPYLSIDCQQNRGSFDPNDKQGFPKGVGPEHFVEPGLTLDYLIRFQNTGTDTAFTVVVRDTLATWLDPATLRSGASSHPYTFRLSEKGVATWTFDRILLPDSTTNLAGSQGFVKFHVGVRPDAPLGTHVQNRAGIYFDFNAPVLTNTTLHTLGSQFLTVKQPDPGSPMAPLRISPNPVATIALVQLPNGPIQSGRLQAFDVRGRLLLELPFTGQRGTLDTAPLPGGVYVLKVLEGRRTVGFGKMVVAR